MKRTAILIYGIAVYALFFLTFLYAIAWVGDLGVPRTVDVGPSAPLGTALAINLALLGIFAVQHSVMARPGFKLWLTRLVPTAAERATYVLASSLAMLALFFGWHPIGGNVWNIESGVGYWSLTLLFFAGPLTVLYATFLIDHFDLFGLRQVVLEFRGIPYSHKRFVTPGPYRYIRHPLYVGWFITFWATPSMSVGHLLLAIGTTAYILIAIYFEERDLDEFLGEEYRAYRRNTPLFIPRLTRTQNDSGAAEVRTA